MEEGRIIVSKTRVTGSFVIQALNTARSVMAKHFVHVIHQDLMVNVCHQTHVFSKTVDLAHTAGQFIMEALKRQFVFATVEELTLTVVMTVPKDVQTVFALLMIQENKNVFVKMEVIFILSVKINPVIKLALEAQNAELGQVVFDMKRGVSVRKDIVVFILSAFQAVKI